MSWITCHIYKDKGINVRELVSVKGWCTVIEEGESTHSSYKEFTNSNKICEIPKNIMWNPVNVDIYGVGFGDFITITPTAEAVSYF